MDFSFRKAKKDDLEPIYELFLLTRKDLEEKGHYFWSHGYPNKEVFQDDLEQGLLYVGEVDGKLVASIGLCPDAVDYFFKGETRFAKTKKLLDFAGCPEGKSSVFERLMVNPSMQGRGIGTKMMFALMKESQADHYLISVFLEDENAIRLYKKIGFIDFGNYPEFEWGDHSHLCGLMARRERYED